MTARARNLIAKATPTPRLSDNTVAAGFVAALAELAVVTMAPIAGEMRRILDDRAYVDGVLSDGGERARTLAEATMRDVRAIIGLLQD